MPTSSYAPWQASARALAQRAGVDPRYVRRLRWLHKASAVRRKGSRLRDHAAWILTAPEPDNYTYEISNYDDLARWVAGVSGVSDATAGALVAEPATDDVLRSRLRRATAGHRWWWSFRSPAFGRRAGWYALVRALRPRVVIEVGAHDGLGSLLLLRALERNADSSSPGRLISFDVNPAAGWLVGTHPYWEMRIEDSRQGLRTLLPGIEPVDLFLYDGWHTADAELADIGAVLPSMSADGLLVSDDAQVTGALARIADAHRLAYHEFSERSIGHFSPGTVTAAALRRPSGQVPAGQRR